MNIEIHQGDVFDSLAKAMVLTVDGSSKGMEGNITRAFARFYPDAWEELEQDISYPIPLGSAKIYSIDPDLGCLHSFCIVASTLHHMDILEEEDKLRIVGSAMGSALSLAASKGVSSVCTAILSGGWRLESGKALAEMIKSFETAKQINQNIPRLEIFVLGEPSFLEIETFLIKSYEGVKKVNGVMVL